MYIHADTHHTISLSCVHTPGLGITDLTDGGFDPVVDSDGHC